MAAALCAVCLSLAVPTAAQAPPVAGRAGLEAEKAALFARLQRDPADPDLTLAYAGVAARLEDNEAAAGALERVLIQNPALAGAALELGVLYFRMGSFQAARAYFARARAAGLPPESAQKISRYDEIARMHRLRPTAATPAAVTAAVIPASLHAAAPQAAARKVGTTAAVNENAVAVVGATRRRLAVRDAIFTTEHLRTDAQGQVQLLLEDASTVTIGPDFDLAVDDFVFDPRNPAGGKIALDIERGKLLLIGGTLSKQPNAVTIRTPSATLAVRGAIVLVVVDAKGGTWAALLYGNQLDITGLNGISQTVTDAGFAVSIDRPGGAPSSPGPVTMTELAGLLAGFDGRPGGSGGAAIVPTAAAFERSGIDRIISGNLLENVGQAMHATLDEAAVAVFGLLQSAPQTVGLSQTQGLTTNRCVTVSPSAPCH